MDIESAALLIVASLPVLAKHLVQFLTPAPQGDAENEAEATSAPQPSKPIEPFRFFDLPGELRNMIYRQALVRDAPGILVTPKGFKRSALLRASKQTHREGLAIFYHENTFNMRVHNFDQKLLCKWAWHLSDTSVRDFKLHTSNLNLDATIYVNRVPEWKDFIVWVRTLHFGYMRVQLPDMWDNARGKPGMMAFANLVEEMLEEMGREGYNRKWNHERTLALLEKAKNSGLWRREWRMARELMGI